MEARLVPSRACPRPRGCRARDCRVLSGPTSVACEVELWEQVPLPQQDQGSGQRRQGTAHALRLVLTGGRFGSCQKVVEETGERPDTQACWEDPALHCLKEELGQAGPPRSQDKTPSQAFQANVPSKCNGSPGLCLSRAPDLPLASFHCLEVTQSSSHPHLSNQLSATQHGRANSVTCTCLLLPRPPAQSRAPAHLISTHPGRLDLILQRLD